MCSPKGFFFFFFSLVPVSFGSGNVGLQLIARLDDTFFSLLLFFCLSFRRLFSTLFRSEKRNVWRPGGRRRRRRRRRRSSREEEGQSSIA